MSDEPTKEYLHLFNAISKVIYILQDTLLIQVRSAAYARETAKANPDEALNFLLLQYKEDMAAVQMLQKFLVKSQNTPFIISNNKGTHGQSVRSR